MSYDIHGNHLRPGHCEVHPYVGQPYPCELCYREHAESAKEASMAASIGSAQYERDIYQKDMHQARGDAADWREKYERASVICAELAQALIACCSVLELNGYDDPEIATARAALQKAGVAQ